MINVRLMTLAGKFAQAGPTVEAATEAEALAIVRAHVAAAGYTCVAVVHDDMDGARVTARTPGGRGGRNVAFLDYSYPEG